jgi:hypothetical protein
VSDESNLMERVCPKCGGELVPGIWVSKTEALASALKCTPCNWVWEKP